MASNKIRTAGLVFAGLALTTAPAFADHGHRSHGESRASQGESRPSARPFQASRQFQSDRSAASRSEVVTGRAVPRPVGPRTEIVPRRIEPRIETVAPYRPYYYRYRPGFSASFYFGSPYYYGSPYGYGDPYGYVTPPPEYLSAIPGRPYGGVRIQNAPRDAQVFVDGYYMGIVDDFDGVFQHMNLEAGPHHVEIREPGYEPIAFDVNVRPGETITYRAEMFPTER
jgi:hypothetical protein